MVQCLENKTDDGLNRLNRNKNVINCIKAYKLSWFGHVDRMENNWTVKKTYDWKTVGRKTKNQMGKRYKMFKNYENK